MTIINNNQILVHMTWVYMNLLLIIIIIDDNYKLNNKAFKIVNVSGKKQITLTNKRKGQDIKVVKKEALDQNNLNNQNTQNIRAEAASTMNVDVDVDKNIDKN